jgi:hypothetical protein
MPLRRCRHLDGRFVPRRMAVRHEPAGSVTLGQSWRQEPLEHDKIALQSLGDRLVRGAWFRGVSRGEAAMGWRVIPVNGGRLLA